MSGKHGYEYRMGNRQKREGEGRGQAHAAWPEDSFWRSSAPSIARPMSAPHDWSKFEAARTAAPSGRNAWQRRNKPGTALAMEGATGPTEKELAEVVAKPVGDAAGKVVDGFARRLASDTGAKVGGRFNPERYHQEAGRQFHGGAATQDIRNARGELREVQVLPTIDEGHEMRTPGWMNGTPGQRREMLQPGAVDERGNEHTYGPNGLQVRGYDPARDRSMNVGHFADPFEPTQWTRTVRIDPKYGGGVGQATQGGGHQGTATQAIRGQKKAMAGGAMSPAERVAYEKVMDVSRQATAAHPWVPKF